MRRWTSLLTQYVRGRGKTLKYEFAVASWAVWLAVTVRLYLSGDPAWIAAQQTNYATLTTTVYLYITAAVITQVVQNSQGGPPARPVSADYPNGDLESPPTPEDITRSTV